VIVGWFLLQVLCRLVLDRGLCDHQFRPSNQRREGVGMSYKRPQLFYLNVMNKFEFDISRQQVRSSSRWFTQADISSVVSQTKSSGEVVSRLLLALRQSLMVPFLTNLIYQKEDS
jgi:hypothetical protein